jgi:glycosyltransferase involved in cell wall biosynthesis
MHTVLVYDHFIARGGAENVSFQVANQLESCVLETAFADKNIFKEELKKEQLKSHNYPYLQTFFPTLFLFYFYLCRFKVNNDASNVILSGVFSPLALFKNRHKNKNKKRPKSIVYFHTFPSFVELSFYTLKKQHGLVGAIVFRLFTPIYLYFLKVSVKKADVVLSNSKSVQARFNSKGITSEVLYPPVDLQGLANKGNKGYFLSTSRLEKNKRIELVLKVFSKNPNITIHMVGGGSLFKLLQLQYSDCSNIKFLGWLDSGATKEQYNYCTALVCIPENEYFGIAPVEAMAAGKPIIGVAEGGLLETVTDKTLGLLLKSPIDISLLEGAVIQVAQAHCSNDDITTRQQHAKQFDESSFIKRLKHHLN